MLFRKVSRGPNRTVYSLSKDGSGRFWIATKYGLDIPSWHDLLKLAWLRLCGIELMEALPPLAGGDSRTLFIPRGIGGGGSSGTDRYAMNVMSGGSISVAASTTYEFSSEGASGPATSPRYPLVVPIASTLIQHYWEIFINGTAASAGNVTHQARKWTASSAWTTASDTTGVAFSWAGTSPYAIGGGETGLSVSYAVGDVAQAIFVTPAWVTAPTGVRPGATLIFTVP